MAFRRPLYIDGSNDLREMSDSQIAQLRLRTVYMHGDGNYGSFLSVTSSGGTLGSLFDSRLVAGASIIRADRFATSGETGNAAPISITYARITEQNQGSSQATDGGTRNFVYYDGSDIRAMTHTDMYDTIYTQTIDLLVDGTDRDGTHRIATSASVSGMQSNHSGSTPSTIFSDTRANTGAYTAGGIAETTDQPFTVTNYYLHRVNQGYGGTPSTDLPVVIDGSNDLQQLSQSSLDSILGSDINYWSGQKIRYSINGSGNNRGSAMVDTRLNGSNYQTRFVNADDYRAQEFPSGSVTTINTYNLRIRRI